MMYVRTCHGQECLYLTCARTAGPAALDMHIDLAHGPRTAHVYS